MNFADAIISIDTDEFDIILCHEGGSEIVDITRLVRCVFEFDFSIHYIMATILIGIGTIFFGIIFLKYHLRINIIERSGRLIEQNEPRITFFDEEERTGL